MFLAISSAPLNHALTLTASTSHSPVMIQLPSLYEGSFSLSSTQVQPVVSLTGDTEDPAEEGRTQVVTLFEGSPEEAKKEGTVFWQKSSHDSNLHHQNQDESVWREEVENRGIVNVSTSKQLIELVIGDLTGNIPAGVQQSTNILVGKRKSTCGCLR
jgi:hypothetical protein